MLYHFYSRLKIELKLGSDARGKGKFKVTDTQSIAATIKKFFLNALHAYGIPSFRLNGVFINAFTPSNDKILISPYDEINF